MAKKQDPVSTAALEIVGAEKMQESLKQSEQQLKEKSMVIAAELVGTIKAMNFMRSLSDITVLVKLKELKESNHYKASFSTWEETCEAMGLKRRTVDEKLADLEPFRDDFLGNFASFFSNDFRKIKYLGKAVSAESAKIEDNAILYNGETIPVTPEHADEIQALIEKLEDDYKAKISDKESELKAQKRIASSKEDVIKKMEKEIKRLERTATIDDLSPEERESFDLMARVQGDIVSLFSALKQQIDYHKAPASVLRSLYFLYIFGSKIFSDERMALNEVYKDAEMVPWEIDECELPPSAVLAKEMPLTKGLKHKKGKK
ncbi:MAG: hypothetical protein EPN22_16860 [Nitrospirae bacterium]|nr:MAG: hypothetical protein EPN22_16860 [Nitrospirota bacterium]